MSKRRKVLVVYKKSSYQQLVRERRSKRVSRLLAEGDPTVRRMKRAHEAHVRTVERAEELLTQLGVSARFAEVGSARSANDASLVVTLGGDGTLLSASHMVGPDVPMLGINTAPRHSVGYFCATDPKSLPDTLRAALAGELRATALTRMQVEVDGEVVSKRVLNDVLYSATCPAETTRYILELGRRREDQRSSGIWIGPAAGSTAAQLSAGGKVLPMGSRKLQFVVREPYQPRGTKYRLVKGTVGPDAELRVRSKTWESCLYLDGPHREHPVRFGAVVRLRRSDEPLLLLGLHRR